MKLQIQTKPLLGFLTLALIAISGDLLADEVTKKLMLSKLPNTPITDANRLPEIPGLIELVVAGKQIFYTNEDASKLVIGHIFDPLTNTDLTQSRIDALNVVDWKSLPLKDAIVIKKGKGERQIAVFTDPDCPFCKKLESELALIDNLTVYIFPFPLDMHPNAKQTSQAIYCSKDKSKAWSEYMVSGVKLSAETSCTSASAIERNIALGQKLGITGTPAIIAKNGKIKAGFAPAAQIEQWIVSNSGGK